MPEIPWSIESSGISAAIDSTIIDIKKIGTDIIAVRIQFVEALPPITAWSVRVVARMLRLGHILEEMHYLPQGAKRHSEVLSASVFVLLCQPLVEILTRIFERED